MIYSEDTFDDSEGSGRVCFYCPLCLFPALMSHPPWGRELLRCVRCVRCVPDTFNKDAPLKKSNQWQRSESPQVSDRRQPARAPVAMPWPVLHISSLQCDCVQFLSKIKSLSIDFLGFSTFPGSLVLLGPSHVLWVCFQLQAFSCSSALPLAFS